MYKISIIPLKDLVQKGETYTNYIFLTTMSLGWC